MSGREGPRLHSHTGWPAGCARSRQSDGTKSVIMTELAEGPTHVGVRRSVAYWNREFQRIHSPILRYGFSVVSGAIDFGVGFALQICRVRDVDVRGHL